MRFKTWYCVDFYSVIYIFVPDAENNYTVYVKDDKYVIQNTLECNTFSYKGVRTIKTISVVCKQPLEGIYIHIVSVLKVPLRVYEIEEFGKIVKLNYCYQFFVHPRTNSISNINPRGTKMFLHLS